MFVWSLAVVIKDNGKITTRKSQGAQNAHLTLLLYSNLILKCSIEHISTEI